MFHMVVYNTVKVWWDI